MKCKENIGVPPAPIHGLANKVRSTSKQKMKSGDTGWKDAANQARRIGKGKDADLLGSLERIGNNDPEAVQLAAECRAVLGMEAAGQGPNAPRTGVGADEVIKKAMEGEPASLSASTYGIDFADIELFETDPESAALFERKSEVVESITESMRRDGFHCHRPVMAWERIDGRLVPYDGNTRLDVARGIPEIKQIPVVKRSFDSREQFLDAAIEEQLNRRNLGVRDKFMLVKYLAPMEKELARGRHGAKRQSAEKSADSSGRAADIVGRRLGCSGDTVSSMLALLEAGDDTLLGKVYSEELSISAAHRKLKKMMKDKAKAQHGDVADTENGGSHPDAAKSDPVIPSGVTGDHVSLELFADDGVVKASSGMDDTSAESCAAPQETESKPSETEDYEIVSLGGLGSGDSERKRWPSKNAMLGYLEIPERLLEILIGHFDMDFVKDLKDVLGLCDKHAVKIVRRELNRRKKAA